MVRRVYRKRRAFRRRGRKVARKMKMYRRPKAAFPRTFMARLKYFDQVSLNPTVGSNVSTYSYKCNDVFDPDAQLGGHQPMGFDQYMAIYGRFRVVASKCSCIFLANDSTSLNSSAVCGILRTTSNSFPGSISVVVENDSCVYRAIQLGDTSRPISIKYNTKKSQGIKNIMDNIELSGTSTGSPAIQDFYQIWIANANPSNDAEPVDIQVQLTYWVVFSDPNLLALS